jgi:Smg protein
MKENLIDILIYLFEHYLVDQADELVHVDNQKLTGELLEVGFGRQEIDQAFFWLDELVAGSDKSLDSYSPVSSFRIFSREEKLHIPLEAQSLIMRLEHAGILELSTRELVIDRLMALEYQAIDMEDAKWVIMMVLCNQSDFPQELEWAESLVSESVLNIH